MPARQVTEHSAHCNDELNMLIAHAQRCDGDITIMSEPNDEGEGLWLAVSCSKCQWWDDWGVK